MQTSAQLLIKGSKEKVWSIVTDIENAKDRIECIKAIEILEKPENSLVGLKWKETREMFGKEAIETMWITEAKEFEYYITEAENCGSVYHSTVKLEEVEEGINLIMSFSSTPRTLNAKLMSPLMLMMKGMIKKAFIKDLEDIKRIVEVE